MAGAKVRSTAPHGILGEGRCPFRGRALLGRFLPRLGPFVLRAAPFLLCAWDLARLSRTSSEALPVGVLYASEGCIGFISQLLSYAAGRLLQCKKLSLPFVRCTATLRHTRRAIVSLPSLGVSSLDLGRTGHRCGLFSFRNPACLAERPRRRLCGQAGD